MFNLLNDHSGNTMLYFGLTELIVVAWVYGIRKFIVHIEEMDIWMPRVLKYFWMLCWTVISPILCMVVFVVLFINREPDQMDGYVYPAGPQVSRSSLSLCRAYWADRVCYRWHILSMVC